MTERRQKIEIKKSGTDKNMEGKKWMMGEYGGVNKEKKNQAEECIEWQRKRQMNHEEIKKC